MKTHDPQQKMKQRDFAYSDVFRHPPLSGSAFRGGHIKADIPPEVARVCKNESNCTVFLNDGTWVTTWGQGSHEGHPGEHRNGGLVFGEPMILAEVDDTGEVNLKTGISMPQFFERDGRYFVCYNINKEHILLDEIPADVLDRLTPALDAHS